MKVKYDAVVLFYSVVSMKNDICLFIFDIMFLIIVCDNFLLKATKDDILGQIQNPHQVYKI